MGTQEDEIVRTADVAREFGLKERLAREIVTQETQRALRRSKVAWLLLLGGMGLSGWLYFGAAANRDSAFWILLGTVAFWLMLGRYLAGPAIRKAAMQKAARLQGLDD